MKFTEIPKKVVEFVRQEFARANDSVSRTLTTQPSMHEEGLDQILVAQLSAAPPTFFASENVAISIESHWLGGRRMYGRWEIADIALFISLREVGRLTTRKVALLQMKRLYAKELAGVELEEYDYVVGIGRLADRVEQLYPLSNQRIFGFARDSAYKALEANSEQQQRIVKYMSERQIPVYYGFYHPMDVPFASLFPITVGTTLPSSNALGCRVLAAAQVHSLLKPMASGASPKFDDLGAVMAGQSSDRHSGHGWRLEHFVADEVMRCKQGKVFEDWNDENLRSLLYERSAPISAAIVITIDSGSEVRRPDPIGG